MRLAMRSCARFAALVFAVLATLALAGCYEVQEEVLRPGDAVRLPGLEGTYQVPGKSERTTIARGGQGNDYSYSKVAEDGTAQSGALRVMPLGRRLYAVQIDSPLGLGWELYFAEFVTDGGGARYRFLYADPPPDGLAAQYGIRIEQGEMVQNLILLGDSANIRDFLLAHADLSLTVEENWWVRQ